MNNKDNNTEEQNKVENITVVKLPTEKCFTGI